MESREVDTPGHIEVERVVDMLEGPWCREKASHCACVSSG